MLVSACPGTQYINTNTRAEHRLKLLLVEHVERAYPYHVFEYDVPIRNLKHRPADRPDVLISPKPGAFSPGVRTRYIWHETDEKEHTSNLARNEVSREVDLAGALSGPCDVHVVRCSPYPGGQKSGKSGNLDHHQTFAAVLDSLRIILDLLDTKEVPFHDLFCTGNGNRVYVYYIRYSEQQIATLNTARSRLLGARRDDGASSSQGNQQSGCYSAAAAGTQVAQRHAAAARVAEAGAGSAASGASPRAAPHARAQAAAIIQAPLPSGRLSSAQAQQESHQSQAHGDTYAVRGEAAGAGQPVYTAGGTDLAASISDGGQTLPVVQRLPLKTTAGATRAANAMKPPASSKLFREVKSYCPCCDNKETYWNSFGVCEFEGLQIAGKQSILVCKTCAGSSEGQGFHDNCKHLYGKWGIAADAKAAVLKELVDRLLHAHGRKNFRKAYKVVGLLKGNRPEKVPEPAKATSKSGNIERPAVAAAPGGRQAAAGAASTPMQQLSVQDGLSVDDRLAMPSHGHQPQVPCMPAQKRKAEVQPSSEAPLGGNKKAHFEAVVQSSTNSVGMSQASPRVTADATDDAEAAMESKPEVKAYCPRCGNNVMFWDSKGRKRFVTKNIVANDTVVKVNVCNNCSKNKDVMKTWGEKCEERLATLVTTRSQAEQSAEGLTRAVLIACSHSKFSEESAVMGKDVISMNSPDKP